MFYEDDIDIFFDVFGEAAVYDGAINVTVIFDNNFEMLNIQTGEIESAGPQVTIKTSAIPNITHGKTLVIHSTTYYIRGIEPDGTGITKLTLSVN